MNNIKFSIFDFFAYLIPGSIILVALVIFFNPSLNEVSDLGRQFEKIDVSTSAVAIVVSYTIGFAADSIGSWLYIYPTCNVLGSPKPAKKSSLTFSEQRALVRQFSPDNFQFIHNWKILKTMSHNLSLAFLILMLPALSKAFYAVAEQRIQWLFVAFIALLMSAVFMHRAHIFDTWHYADLTTAVKALHLDKRALNEASLSQFENSTPEPN